MTFPQLPTLSGNSFLDHFSGSSLDSTKWGSVTSGTGAVTVTDSYAQCSAPADSAAFIYYKTQLDKTKSQLWTIAVNRTSGLSGGSPTVWLVNGASAPAADTSTNIVAKTLAARAHATQTGTCIFDWYWDSSGTQHFWGGASGGESWTSTYSSSLMSISPAQLDDYYILGVEFDGVNSRWRLLGWHQTFATAGTWDSGQGWRLSMLSDWTNWSSTRSNSNVWLAIGQLYNDDSTAKTTRVEWVRYAEAPSGNTVVDAWAAGKANLASAHRIRHLYSYDALTYVPDDRTSWALDLGSGSPDNSEVQEPWVVYDGNSTDYMFYTGSTGGIGANKSICVASASHVSAGTGQSGTWTRFGSNPILSLGSSGSFDDKQMGFACVVCDLNETNSAKRWKMLYTGMKNADGLNRIGYATASSPTGTWTKQGVVLDVGGSGANDEKACWGMAIVFYNKQWEVWYEGHDASGTCHLMRATGTDLGSLTKDATYYSPPSGTDQLLTANLSSAPGRTVTVGSTTGFSVDATVILSGADDNDTYSTSKIRKVVSGTSLELYHGLTGFTTGSTPAGRIKQTDSGPNFSPRLLTWNPNTSEWWAYINLWEPFFNSSETASYAAVLEEAHLFKHSAAAPSGGTFAIQYQPSPVTSRGFNNDEESFENMTLLNSPVPLSPSSSGLGRFASPVYRWKLGRR